MPSDCVSMHVASATPQEKLRAEELARSLESLGARLVGKEVPPTGTSADTPHIVVFDSVTTAVVDQLTALSLGGLFRVMAVTLSPAPPQVRDSFALLHAGASDVLAGEDATELAKQIVARLERWSAVDELLRLPVVQRNLAGLSRGWIALLRQVVESARFTSSDVLLLGESRTGKELLARLIHTLDNRTQKHELVVLDCTTIVPELSGSEFFGHERGAFTGASTGRDGAFALANGGTLFLDEVGELPRALQSQLLRVIQEHSFKRIGGNNWQKTDFRLVCATNKDLRNEVARGTFRADLYYRMAGQTFRLPPLRDRPEDIPVLARYFVKQLMNDGEAAAFDPAVRDFLMTRDYPGNIRDLKQVVSRMLHRHVGAGPITIGAISAEDRPLGDGSADSADSSSGWDGLVRRALAQGLGLKDIGRLAEGVAVRVVVQDEEGNLQRAARRLRVSDRALQMRRATGRMSGPSLAEERAE